MPCRSPHGVSEMPALDCRFLLVWFPAPSNCLYLLIGAGCVSQAQVAETRCLYNDTARWRSCWNHAEPLSAGLGVALKVPASFVGIISSRLTCLLSLSLSLSSSSSSSGSSPPSLSHGQMANPVWIFVTHFRRFLRASDWDEFVVVLSAQGLSAACDVKGVQEL